MGTTATKTRKAKPQSEQVILTERPVEGGVPHDQCVGCYVRLGTEVTASKFDANNPNSDEVECIRYVVVGGDENEAYLRLEKPENVERGHLDKTTYRLPWSRLEAGAMDDETGATLKPGMHVLAHDDRLCNEMWGLVGDATEHAIRRIRSYQPEYEPAKKQAREAAFQKLRWMVGYQSSGVALTVDDAHKKAFIRSDDGHHFWTKFETITIRRVIGLASETPRPVPVVGMQVHIFCEDGGGYSGTVTAVEGTIVRLRDFEGREYIRPFESLYLASHDTVNESA